MSGCYRGQRKIPLQLKCGPLSCCIPRQEFSMKLTSRLLLVCELPVGWKTASEGVLLSDWNEGVEVGTRGGEMAMEEEEVSGLSCSRSSSILGISGLCMS